MKTPFFFWSRDGSSFPMALVLKREGHPVTFYVHSLEARDIGTGLVPKTSRPIPTKGAVVIFDCTGRGAAGNAYREQGFKVIGGSPADKELELDRPAGAKLMNRHGIKTPPTKPFSGIPTAIKFLESQEGAWFVKVSGDTVESATFDAPTPADMIRYLRWVESQGDVHPFELQKKVSGIEVSCSGWFDGDHFIPPYQITLEEKRAFTGNLGPRTGCESCVVWNDDDRLASLGVLRIEDYLRKTRYVGQIDLNQMVQDDGTPLGIEWTARLGFDFNSAWMDLITPGTIGEQLAEFANGHLDTFEGPAHYASTLRISVPPYPYWNEKVVRKIRGLPLDERLKSHEMMDPVDVMVNSNGLVSAGASGIVGTVNATGGAIPGLKKELLRLADSLVIPNKQHRVDPLSRVERDLAGLVRLNLVTSPNGKAVKAA